MKKTQSKKKRFNPILMPINSTFMNISNTDANSLSFIKRFDQLINLNASNTLISDLKGVQISESILHIQLDGTPFSKNEYYRIMLLIGLSPLIRTIDKMEVTSCERELANTLQSSTLLLIYQGYIIKNLDPLTLILNYDNNNPTKINSNDNISKTVVIPPNKIVIGTKQSLSQIKAQQTFAMIEDLSNEIQKTANDWKIQPIKKNEVGNLLKEIKKVHNEKNAKTNKQKIRRKRILDQITNPPLNTEKLTDDNSNNVLNGIQQPTNKVENQKIVDYQIYTSLIKMLNSNKTQIENDDQNTLNDSSTKIQNEEKKQDEPPKSPKLSKSELAHLLKEKRKQNSSILENSLIETTSKEDKNTVEIKKDENTNKNTININQPNNTYNDDVNNAFNEDSNLNKSKIVLNNNNINNANGNNDATKNKIKVIIKKKKKKIIKVQQNSKNAKETKSNDADTGNGINKIDNIPAKDEQLNENKFSNPEVFSNNQQTKTEIIENQQTNQNINKPNQTNPQNNNLKTQNKTVDQINQNERNQNSEEIIQKPKEEIHNDINQIRKIFNDEENKEQKITSENALNTSKKEESKPEQKEIIKKIKSIKKSSLQTPKSNKESKSATSNTPLSTNNNEPNEKEINNPNISKINQEINQTESTNSNKIEKEIEEDSSFLSIKTKSDENQIKNDEITQEDVKITQENQTETNEKENSTEQITKEQNLQETIKKEEQETIKNLSQETKIVKQFKTLKKIKKKEKEKEETITPVKDENSNETKEDEKEPVQIQQNPTNDFNESKPETNQLKQTNIDDSNENKEILNEIDPIVNNNINETTQKEE